MKMLKTLFWNTLLVAISIAGAHYLAIELGQIYVNAFSLPSAVGGSWIGSESSDLYLTGLSFAYILFLTSLMIGLGRGLKNTWTIVFLIPAVLYILISSDYLYIALNTVAGIVGVVIGFGINKLISQLKKKPKVQPTQ